MKPFEATHIDFTKPQRPPTRPWALLMAGLMAAAWALGMLTAGMRAFQAAELPAPTIQPAVASPPLAPAQQHLIGALQSDLRIFEQSIERPLPAGIQLMALSASQETQRITLLASAPSAQALLTLPRWLAADQGLGPWRIERIARSSDRSAHYTGALSCNGCWQPTAVAAPGPTTRAATP